MKKIVFVLFLGFLFNATALYAQWYPTGFTITSFPWNNSSGGIFYSKGGLWIAPKDRILKFYSSLDTGKTWTSHVLPDQGPITSFRFLDNLNGIANVAGADCIEITTDGGQSWTEIYSGGTDAGFLGSPNTVLRIFPGQMVLSDDGGKTVSSWILTGDRSFAVTPKITVFGGYDPVEMSTDFGRTWQSRQARFNLESNSMDVGKLCDDSTLYFAHEWDQQTQNGAIYISTDAGNSFFIRYPNSPLGYICGSMVTTRHAAYCATSSSGILRSTDKGQSWVSIGGPGLPFDVRCITAVNDNILFALDSLGNLWETTNCGGDPIIPPPPPMPQISSSAAKATSCDSGKASASLTHTYCDALTVTDATLQGVDAAYFTLLSQTIPVSLGNGAKINFNLGFNPKKEVRSFSAGIHVKGFYIFEYEDTIRIDTVIPINATSTPVPPNLVIPNAFFIFDTLSTCLPPVDTIVTFINKGCDTLLITDTSGVNSSEFTLLPPFTLPVKIPPGGSINVGFKFKPSGTGTFSTDPHFIAEQQGLKQDIKLHLEGSGKYEGGVLSYSPQVFNFQSLSICSHDSASGFITNVGCDSIALDPAKIFGNPDFKLTANSLQLTVKTGDTVYYKVYLNPTQKGLRTGYIIFTSVNSRDSIPLSVIVTDGTKILSSSVQSVDFGTVSVCDTRDTSVTLTNSGCDTLIVTGINGLNQGFGTTTKFPVIILPNHDTTIDIFTLLDTAGGKTSSSATLTFTSDADTISPIRPITIMRTYSIGAHRDLGLFLDPTPKSAGDLTTVSYDIKETPGKTFAGAGIKQVNFDLTYNTNLLTFEQAQSTNVISANGNNFTITGLPNIQADANGILASIGFKVFLTTDSTTTIDLLNVQIDTTHPPCGSVTFSYSGSATFDYTFLCGDRTLQNFMNGVIPMKIISLRPNPAQDEVEVDCQWQVVDGQSHSVTVTIFDMMGKSVYSEIKNLSGGLNTFTIDTKNLSGGMYLVRIGSSSQSFVKVR